VIDVAFLENDGLGDSLHAVLDQVRVEVPVAALVEVSGVNFGDDVLDIYQRTELLALFHLENSFFEVVVGW
jgi:hypothetical protein